MVWEGKGTRATQLAAKSAMPVGDLKKRSFFYFTLSHFTLAHVSKFLRRPNAPGTDKQAMICLGCQIANHHLHDHH